VSRAVSDFFGRGNVAIRGTISGLAMKGTLVPTRPSGHVLHLNAEIRRGAGAEVGDTVVIVLEFDSEPRVRAIPWRSSLL
jgi:hypothetical protein